MGGEGWHVGVKMETTILEQQLKKKKEKNTIKTTNFLQNIGNLPLTKLGIIKTAVLPPLLAVPTSLLCQSFPPSKPCECEGPCPTAPLSHRNPNYHYYYHKNKKQNKTEQKNRSQKGKLLLQIKKFSVSRPLPAYSSY